MSDDNRIIVFRNPEGKIAKYRATDVVDQMVRQRQDTFKKLPDSYERAEANKHSYVPVGVE